MYYFIQFFIHNFLWISFYIYNIYNIKYILFKKQLKELLAN